MAAEQSCAVEAVVDVEDLLGRCLGNIEFAEHILIVFQDRCGKDMDELQQVIEGQDMEGAARIAHRLQGACANAAAVGLKSRAANLRSAAVGRVPGDVCTCFDELRKEWDQFLAFPSPLSNANDAKPST